MIDLTLPADTLDADTRSRLVNDLLYALLKWEGAPDNARSRSLAWAFTHDAEVAVLNSPSGLPHYRVEVTTPQGALDDERRSGLVTEVTELVLRAEGAAITIENSFRVWVLLHEIRDGHWGAAARIWRLSDIAAFVVDPVGPMPGVGRDLSAASVTERTVPS